MELLLLLEHQSLLLLLEDASVLASSSSGCRRKRSLRLNVLLLLTLEIRPSEGKSDLSSLIVLVLIRPLPATAVANLDLTAALGLLRRRLEGRRMVIRLLILLLVGGMLRRMRRRRGMWTILSEPRVLLSTVATARHRLKERQTGYKGRSEAVREISSLQKNEAAR